VANTSPYWDPEYLDLLAGAVAVLDKNRIALPDPDKETVVKVNHELSERLDDS
jgi:hypothetical protein